jgi:hypothetical protein
MTGELPSDLKKILLAKLSLLLAPAKPGQAAGKAFFVLGLW